MIICPCIPGYLLHKMAAKALHRNVFFTPEASKMPPLSDMTYKKKKKIQPNPQ